MGCEGKNLSGAMASRIKDMHAMVAFTYALVKQISSKIFFAEKFAVNYFSAVQTRVAFANVPGYHPSST